MTIDDIFEDNDNYLDQNYDFKEWCSRLKDVSASIVVSSNGVNFAKSYQEQFAGYQQGHYFDMNDYYAEYYGSYYSSRQNNNQGSHTGVGKCTKCGKFKKFEDLIDIDEEMLCESCLVKMEFGVGV